MNTKNKEESTAAVVAFTRKKITTNVEKVALFNFSIAVMLSLTPEGLTVKIKEEKEKIKKSGLDPVKIQSLIDCYKLTKTQNLSREEAALTAYNFLVYCVADGVSVIGWISRIFPAPFCDIFTKTSQPLEVLDQLVTMKHGLDKLKNQSFKYQAVPFETDLHSWAVRFRSQKEYEYAGIKFELKGILLSYFSEFLICLIDDSSYLIRNKVSDAALKQKEFLAKEIDCSIETIETWANEFRKPLTNFNVSNNSIVNYVNTALQLKGITYSTILALNKFNKSLAKPSVGSAS